ncbi:MAG: M23 family metallopeptidase [Candidatus Caldatribacteriota bacterium]
MKLVQFSILAFILACSTQKVSGPKEEVSEKVTEREVLFIEEEIRPGDIKFIKLPMFDNVSFSCRGQKQNLSHFSDGAVGVVIETYFTDFKPFQCEVRVGEELSSVYTFTVVERKFSEETLRVSPRTIKLSKPDQDRVWREQQILNKIYASSLPELLIKEPFIKPLDSKITSIYGVRRLYNNVKRGQHLGTDFRAAIGVKIPATNRGKVVLARDLFYTGHTVILDHGLDIFTVYGHLSKTLVKEGDIVERGDLIGLSGNTGRTSGPHLHWGVKVQGQYVDGMVLVDESEKFFLP